MHSASEQEQNLSRQPDGWPSPFSEERVRLGLDLSLGELPEKEDSQLKKDSDGDRDEVVEMRNSVGLWERRSRVR